MRDGVANQSHDAIFYGTYTFTVANIQVDIEVRAQPVICNPDANVVSSTSAIL